MASIPVTVKCYAGYRGEQVPRSFEIGGSVKNVSQIVDMWLDPEHRYFKLFADDNGTYLLRHDSNTQLWELIVFDQDNLRHAWNADAYDEKC